MAKRYLKNEKGIVRAITTDNLQLEKPMLNENYDINVHNRNMDKLDSAVQEVKGKIDGLELIASKVTMLDGSTVEDTVTANKTSILNNTSLANQALNKANEAFQRGDNVKTQLVDKLISEGLDVSTNNTFEELIGNIALGKKMASGVVNTTNNKLYYTDINGNNRQYHYTATISNLSFKPSIILLYGPIDTLANVVISIYYKDFKNIACTMYYKPTIDQYNTTSYPVLLDMASSNVITDNMITMPVYGSNSTMANKQYNWVAFE